MGRAMLGMLAVWSQLEADLVSERTRDALAHLRSKGVKLGAPGMIEHVVQGQRRHDANKVALVRRVQTLFATGRYSHRSLATHLNESEVRTTSGEGRWWPRTIRKALALALPSETEIEEQCATLPDDQVPDPGERQPSAVSGDAVP
jgi:DNA invertase Pin-like site-specific DNA recombinase